MAYYVLKIALIFDLNKVLLTFNSLPSFFLLRASNF